MAPARYEHRPFPDLFILPELVRENPCVRTSSSTNFVRFVNPVRQANVTRRDTTGAFG
jgi:hypothetical protein